MAYSSPIKIKEIAKKGILDEKRFFQLLSEQNNYIDINTTKDFYMGLVRMITKELRDNGIVRLPHLGDIAMVRLKDKIGWAGKFQGIIRGKYMMKFFVNQTWKKYFIKLGEKPGREGKLDPREKVLNEIL
jgi:hypothetical protein